MPIPPDAHPAFGTDGTLVVWQPSTDKLWDFWRAVHEEDGWHASWGGATQERLPPLRGSPTKQAGREPNPGGAPRGARSVWWEALITLEDLEKGVIDRGCRSPLPDVRAGVYASPALRTDGESDDPLSLPEGAHLRLDPSLDLDSLNLPRITLMIARAAQRYGIIVNNGAANVAFYAQDSTPTGNDPYRGPDGYFEGSYPRKLLSSFPWSHLRLLKMDLHSWPSP